MIIKHRGFKPVIDPTAYIAPTAVLVGNITVGKNSRIMYGSILDSEGSKIKIRDNSIICENAVLRATAQGNKEYPVNVGDNVFVSPHATLIGCQIQSYSYIATGATVLQGAFAQSGAAIAVGALVHANTVIPSEVFIPPQNIAIGDPMKIYSPDNREDLTKAIKSIEFAKTAFNIDAKWENRKERYKEATEVRSKEFKSHFDDDILN